MDNLIKYQSMGIKADLLWTNPDLSGTGALGGVTISVDLTKYDGALIYFKLNTYTSVSTTQGYAYQYFPKGNTYGCAVTDEASNRTNLRREIKATDDGVYFGVKTGWIVGSSVGYSISSSNYYDAPPPVYIYGIKIKGLV